MLQTLGGRIAYYRKQNEMTQEQLAEKCSVSAQAVSKWENDLTAPDISLLPRLAELFRCTCDELLGVERKTVVAVDPETIDLAQTVLKLRVCGNFQTRGEGQQDLGKTKINVNLPLSVADVLLSSGLIPIEALKGIDFKQIVSLVKQGVIGKLVEIEAEEDDISVEIWVE